VGRQDSQNGSGYDDAAPSSPAPSSGNPQAGRASVPVSPASPQQPQAPRPSAQPSTSSGRASVPVASARAAVPPGVSDFRQPAVQPGGPPQGATGDGVGAAAAKPKTDPGGRTGAVVVSAVVVLLAIAAVLAVVKPGPVKGWLAFGDATTAPTTAAASSDPQPTPVLKAANADAPAPTAAGVKAAIGQLVKAKPLGSSVNVSVVDVATNQPLFQQNADAPATPASTTKLLTALTVLAARGPSYRLTTRVVAGSNPGEVVLIGGGDPTMAVNGTGQFPGAARLDKLAAQVKKALGGTKPTKVSIDTSLFSGPTTGIGWSSGMISPEGQVAAIQSLMTNAGRIKPVHHEVGADPRYSDPAMAAGKAFAQQLGVPTSAVSRGKAPTTAPVTASAAPTDVAPGTELGEVQSPPLVQVIDWMLEQSDNVIAESMGRQVALAAGKPATFDGASQAMIDKLTELGLPGDEANLYDASGLSKHNGISPTVLTDLLVLAASGDRPELTSLFGGLPVAGWSGTLQSRFATPSPNKVGQGVVRAKTGSLSGVNTMAGELITKDGRLLVFALMADKTGETGEARQALDKIAARLVECGC
jgi:D-alanyl-D-alanine carboxypeptidase/D-alanyl-D-alanine-endopeptidase (penicillin-binding protein 4)